MGTGGGGYCFLYLGKKKKKKRKNERETKERKKPKYRQLFQSCAVQERLSAIAQGEEELRVVFKS